MRPFFPRWSNTAIRLSLFVLLAAAIGGLSLIFLYVRSPIFTRQQEAPEQPVEFDHRHHVADNGIDCRYCHQTVDKAASAGYPATALCMNCHNQIWNQSPLLDPVRHSYFSDQPINWRRVYRVPDFVFFNHSIHVRQGVGCESCHGRLDQMARVEQATPLTMIWCLECHRGPASQLRPRSEMTTMGWQANRADLGAALEKEYGVQARTSCTTCHR